MGNTARIAVENKNRQKEERPVWAHFSVVKKSKWRKEVVTTFHTTLSEALKKSEIDKQRQKNVIILKRGEAPNTELFFLHMIVK